MIKYIRFLLWKRKKKKQCKAMGYYCPDCIYHNFQFDGAIFRGNLCLFPKEWR